VSARAADLALRRYEAGDGAQLDLLAAQRDAFAADAGRIEADAELVNSRAQLRVASGESLLEPPPRAAHAPERGAHALSDPLSTTSPRGPGEEPEGPDWPAIRDVARRLQLSAHP
jgi:hypothetical protein